VSEKLQYSKQHTKRRMMDRKKLIIGMVAVAVLALGGGVAIAAQQQEEPKIDRAAAEEAALGAVPGEVTETELENEGGSAVYEVEVAGKDGKLREVTVDAGNGRVLGQEMEEEEVFEEDNDSEDEGSEDAE
jgi:uncharacterized membrane protein YkoI